MDADRLIPLLGRLSDDPEVEAALVELRTKLRPELPEDEDDEFRNWLLVRRQGVEFGFIDPAYFNAEEIWKRRQKMAPLLMYQLYFHNAFEDLQAFKDKLPFDIEWSDDRQAVRRKLEVYERYRRSYKRDAWRLPAYWLTVSYKKGGKIVDEVVCHLDLKPWPEKGREQPDLAVADWLDLLGLPASSPRLRKRLRPLDLIERIEDEGDDGEVVFRHECGLELVFTAARDLKGPYRTRLERGGPETMVLGAVRMYRARGLDSREWTGELPYGLSFDDSQESAQEKIGAKPDEHADSNDEGYVEWRFRDYHLHVLYDNMKNRVTRITIMAPGFD